MDAASIYWASQAGGRPNEGVRRTMKQRIAATGPPRANHTKWIIEIPMPLPTQHGTEHHMQRSRRVSRQRRVVREALQVMAKPVPPPVVISLTRVSTRICDDDRAIASLAAVRDEVARFVCGFEYEARRPRRAPDGGGDGIEWCYYQQLVRHPPNYQGVIVEIETKEPS